MIYGGIIRLLLRFYRSLMMIEVLDAEHCLINDSLVDIPKIDHWINSRSWGGHNPIQAFYRLRSLLKDLASGSKWNETLEYRFIHDLIRINNCGFHVPDEVFSSMPGLYRHKICIHITSWSVNTVVDNIMGVDVYPLWEPADD